jgi:flagellin-like protein
VQSASRKAISPVIATVIIVAVAIAISIAVAGWLFGLWGGLAGGNPQLQVSYLTVYSNGTVAVHIKNQGAGADKLLKAELIANNTTCQLTLQSSSQDIGANQDVDLTLTVSSSSNCPSLTAGESVVVKLYFEKSGVVPITTTVQP